jgi:perosamine synthetase
MERPDSVAAPATAPATPIDMFRVYVCEEAIQAATAVLRSGHIGEGPVVKAFEREFANISGSPYNVAVNSGTSALHLAMILAGVDSGDEVITTAQTMMATSHAILMQRARPVFADIQPRTGNIDPGDITARITPRTKAIAVVHWAGYPCDMDQIAAVAREHGLVVIEDAAHAIGATYRNRPVGSGSPFTCFSFQAIKHVTAGDGGMLTVAGEEDRIAACRLRWFGIDRDRRKPSEIGEPEWNVERLGFKYHMNDIAAAIGLANLKYLSSTIERRRQIARRYRDGLAGVSGIELLDDAHDRESACWLFTALVDRRTDCVRMLRSMNIHASVVHLRIDRNALYGGERRDLPHLAAFTERHLSLPVHEGLSDEQVDWVIATLREGW